MVVATPGTVKEGKEFDADIKIPVKDIGIPHNPFTDQKNVPNHKNVSELEFQIRTARVPGTIQILSKIVTPGKYFSAHIKLAQSVALGTGLEVRIRNKTKVVATGIIRKVGP
nr:hypothetical protein [uncultured Fibrobacter sp.]